MMADAADIAADHTATLLAAQLGRRGSAALPAGVAGECEDCGEDMPRLVGGLCGFCRDDRRPPAAQYEAAAARRASAPDTKEATMPNPTPSENYRAITLPATGAILRAITARAEADGQPLGRTVLTMLEEALEEPALPPVPIEVTELADAPLDDLLAALRRRMEGTVSLPDYEAAVTRAREAEDKLALVGGILSGHVVAGTSA